MAVDNRIFDAARTGDTGLLNELLAGGAEVNCADGRGFTPLILATYNNQPEAARILLESGADINARTQVVIRP